MFKPSMLVDLEEGRPMEVEPIVGNIVKTAKSVGIDVPRSVLESLGCPGTLLTTYRLEVIYAQLRVTQRQMLHTRRQ